MRSIWLIGILAAGLGCGGGQAAQEPAQGPSGSTSASPAVEDGGGAPSGGEGTTTTSALGDAGEAPGMKLPDAPAQAPADTAPKAGHAHEPGRTAADIAALVKARRDEARACYDTAVTNHPGIEGDIVITWTIDPKGGVSGISYDVGRSTIAESTLVDCLGGVIKKIQFAPSPGGYETKANYPFNFHPHHAKHH